MGASFACDATVQPYENENAAFLDPTMIPWPSLFYITYKYATDTNYLEEGGAIVPIHMRKEMNITALEVMDFDVTALEVSASKNGVRWVHDLNHR